MLTCEGYRMFRGSATVKTVYGDLEASGTWLYKPEYDCWYCNGSSYPAEIVSNIREEN